MNFHVSLLSEWIYFEPQLCLYYGSHGGKCEVSTQIPQLKHHHGHERSCTKFFIGSLCAIIVTTLMIKKMKGKYVVLSEKTGRSFGSYATKAGAERRLGQIEMFKHMKSGVMKSPARKETRGK